MISPPRNEEKTWKLTNSQGMNNNRWRGMHNRPVALPPDVAHPEVQMPPLTPHPEGKGVTSSPPCRQKGKKKIGEEGDHQET